MCQDSAQQPTGNGFGNCHDGATINPYSANIPLPNRTHTTRNAVTHPSGVSAAHGISKLAYSLEQPIMNEIQVHQFSLNAEKLLTRLIKMAVMI